MIVPILLFILGFVLLIKGGDWFVDGAVNIAHRFHLPELLIGATVVSIGTTLPEVMVSSTAAFQGQAETAYGNAIGSVICNTALISALTLAIRPTTAKRKTLLLPVGSFFVAAIFYCLIAYLMGEFNRWTGIVLLVMFAFYMFISIKTTIKNKDEDEVEEAEATEEEPDKKKKETKLWLDIVLLVVGAALIAVGAKLLVDNGTKIAEWLGVPESVIALTFIALGTSLPELVTAITSLAKGHSSLSLGNVIGANLFNIVLVCGMAITIRPFAIPVEKTFFDTGISSSFVVDIPVMLLSMLILALPPIIKGKMYRWQGIVLLLIYIAYCIFQFAL